MTSQINYYELNKLRNMRNAKIEKQRNSEESRRILLPDKRKELILIDHDFGTVKYHFNFYKTNNIRQYDIMMGNHYIYKMIGFNRFLKELGKENPPVSAYFD